MRLHILSTFLLITLISSCSDWSSDDLKAGEQISVKEVEKCLRVNDDFSERMTDLISQKSEGDANKSSFMANYFKVKNLAEQAEKEASAANGMQHSRYRHLLRRLLAVQAYIRHSELKDEMITEIKKRKHMTEKDYQDEAERSFQETENWFASFREKLTLAEKTRDERVKEYIKEVEARNSAIRESNASLPPDPAIVELKKRLEEDKAKLTDPRFRTMTDGIAENISKMEEIIARLEKKDARKRKREKKPDPRVIQSFDRPVQNIKAQIASHEKNVMAPFRELGASGELLETIKDTNQKKVREYQATLKRVDTFLASQRLRQAAKDLPIVDQAITRERLMSLMPLRPDDRPEM